MFENFQILLLMASSLASPQNLQNLEENSSKEMRAQQQRLAEITEMIHVGKLVIFLYL